NFGGGLHQFRILLAEFIAEPARQLEFQQPYQTFRTYGGGTLSPDCRSILAIPGGGVDQGQRADAGVIQAGQCLRHASAHGTARGYGGLPTHMVEQFLQIARETCHSKRLYALAGASMPAAIVGEDIGVDCDAPRNAGTLPGCLGLRLLRDSAPELRRLRWPWRRLVPCRAS